MFPSCPATGRLLRMDAAPAAWNMAVDEVLLENAASSGQLALRFYGWAKPSISLGYFQAYDDRRQHPTSLDCPLVRRTSGGGALIHDTPDHDLTYSLAVPDVPRRSQAQQTLYHQMHDAVRRAVRELALEPRLCEPDEADVRRPFLCFLRRSPGDLLVGDHKIMGSAQRRSAAAVLQHGTLLLAQSPAAPELFGLSQLCRQEVSSDAILERWRYHLHQIWPVAWTDQPLSDQEVARAHEKVAKKFGHPVWNRRR